MALSIPDIKFELSQVYKTYADQLLLAASISGIMLESSNMDSAGEQIEGSLRKLLADLLPQRVCVSHGHIVDKNASISNQQDVLIADSFYSRSLIKSLDGTEFYPYESVYATGEVKKTWSQSKLIAALGAIERIKKDLQRKSVPPNHIESGSNFIQLNENITKNPSRNPLFSFTFSIDFDTSYTPDKIALIYNESSNKGGLPNLSVVLKRGIFVCISEEQINHGTLQIKLYPEFTDGSEKCRWVFIKMEPHESFAYLIFMITQHLNDTILEKVATMDYGATMIEIPKTNISPL